MGGEERSHSVGTFVAEKWVESVRNVWSMKWRVPSEGVDQRKLGECGKRLSGT